MSKRNPQFSQLSPNYLFPEVMKRVHAFKMHHPNAELISLSIGDTSEPLAPIVTSAIKKCAAKLSTHSGYVGYGPEQGLQPLREKVAETLYANRVTSDEIFISDGAKCDIARLQFLFDKQITVAIQDPVYPVYVDTSLLGGERKLIYLPCTPANNFFPYLEDLPPIDLIYICSPNNPTGAAYTKDQLTTLVNWAQKNHVMIIYDAAYSGFIKDPHLPRSIYEIAGAKKVAIEVSSFSKLAGFTGVRLGWSVIPKELFFTNGASVHEDYTRLVTTCFNGASILSQAGAMAALSDEGLREIDLVISFYLDNARIVRHALESKGLSVYGGRHAPYLWVNFGQIDSWTLFQTMLEEMHLITTPGSGFGKSGESFLRFSAFGQRENILKAIERIEMNWPEHLCCELLSPLLT